MLLLCLLAALHVVLSHQLRLTFVRTDYAVTRKYKHRLSQILPEEDSKG